MFSQPNRKIELKEYDWGGGDCGTLSRVQKSTWASPRGENKSRETLVENCAVLERPREDRIRP
jgi:hypothetical protein